MPALASFAPAKWALVCVASLSLHLGLVYLLAKAFRPPPLPGGGRSLSPPIDWVELEEAPPSPANTPKPGEIKTPESPPALPPALEKKPRGGLAKARPPEEGEEKSTLVAEPMPDSRPPREEERPLAAGLGPPALPEGAAFVAPSNTAEGRAPGEGFPPGGDVGPKPGGGVQPSEAGGLAGDGPGGGAGGESDAALQQRLQAQAYGCYPVRARRFRFQGTARLFFCVDAGGMATRTRLSQSSGYGSLDEAALACVLKKAQPLPPSSRGRCFLAPVAFGMPGVLSP